MSALFNGGIIDQGFVQAILVLLVREEKQVLRLLRNIPKPTVLVWCSVSEEVRMARMRERQAPPRDYLSSDAQRVFIEHSPRVAELIEAQLLKTPLRHIHIHSSDALQQVERLMKETNSPYKHIQKTISFYIAYICAVVTFQNPKRVYALMYHSVGEGVWKHTIPVKDFKKQMAYVAQHFHSFSTDDLSLYLQEKTPIPRKAVVVTFDDGYKDFLTAALPILETYNIKATLHVTTNVEEATDPFSCERLSEADIQFLSTHPLVSIASHGQTHRNLVTLPLNEVEEEVRGSKEALTRMTGVEPSWFAYPFGARSKQIEDVVTRMGYTGAFGITEGSVSRKESLYAVRRIQVDRTISYPLFMLRLTPAVDIYAWARKRFRIHV